MFLVSYYLDKSSRHGIGIFAGEYISAGTPIYQGVPELNLILTEEEVSRLPEGAQEYLAHYGYKDQHDGKIHLEYDNIRYCNHASDANTTNSSDATSVQYQIVAKRDIQKGEEMTQNYEEFESIRPNLVG